MPRAYHTSPWLKRVLIPFWVVRILFMAIVVAAFGAALVVLSDWRDQLTDDNDIVYDPESSSIDTLTKDQINGAIDIVAVFFALIAICLLLDILSIILFAMQRLKPRTFLIFNVLQTALWLIILILDLVSVTRTTRTSAFGVLFEIVEFLVFVGLLIYASVVYHRDRRDLKKTGRGAYSPTANLEQAESLSYAPGAQMYQEAYAPGGYRGNGLAQVPMQMHDYYDPAADRHPSPHPPIPFPSASPYVLPGPHPSVAVAQPKSLPAGHPTTGAPPYVLPPSPYKDAREETTEV